MLTRSILVSLLAALPAMPSVSAVQCATRPNVSQVLTWANGGALLDDPSPVNGSVAWHNAINQYCNWADIWHIQPAADHAWFSYAVPCSVNETSCCWQLRGLVARYLPAKQWDYVGPCDDTFKSFALSLAPKNTCGVDLAAVSIVLNWLTEADCPLYGCMADPFPIDKLSTLTSQTDTWRLATVAGKMVAVPCGETDCAWRLLGTVTARADHYRDNAKYDWKACIG